MIDGVAVELRAVRYVLAVAETLHFGRASDRVLVSQPSLSRQVRALEREIGVTLFDRTSRRVTLTAAGAAFVPVAQRALELLELGGERARESARGQLGQLRLGFVATAAIDVLPRVLTLHRARRPQVSVILSECATAEQMQLLLTGDLDVGFGRDMPAIEGLRVDVIRTEAIRVAVPDAHPLARLTTIRPSDLAGQPIVRLPPGMSRRADLLLAQVSASAMTDSPDPADVQQARQYMTLLALIAAGMGIALVPQPVTELRQDGVRYVPLEHADATSALTLASRTDDRSPAICDFRELILRSDLSYPEGAGPTL